MTAHDGFNFAAFRSAAERWRAKGYPIISPHEVFGGHTGLDRATYMRVSHALIAAVDGVVLLAGWESSPGATHELRGAEELGLEVHIDLC